MSELISQIVSTLIQIIVFTLIPFVFFLFRKNKQLNFLNYIGLYKAPAKSIVFASSIALLFLIGAIGLVFFDENIKQAMFLPNSVTGKLHQMGFNTTTVIILLIIAWFKTSFAEELLFRGFIAKQFTNNLGAAKGNIIQAIIFGVVHLLLFSVIAKAVIIQLIFIFIFSTGAGWSIGYIKEKYANGSIIPGWIAHGLGNTLAYFIIAFLI